MREVGGTTESNNEVGSDRGSRDSSCDCQRGSGLEPSWISVVDWDGWGGQIGWSARFWVCGFQWWLC